MTGLRSINRIAAAFAIGISILLPGFASIVDEPVLVAALLLGLPHGALDDYVEASLSGRRRGRAAFYAVYLGSIAFMALLWWLSPVLALTGFLVLAGLHFGEADTQDLPVNTGPRWVLTASRAALVIGLPLVAWPALTWPNVAALLGSDMMTPPVWLPELIVPLLAQHFFFFGVLSTDSPDSIWDTALLSGLFLFATPALSLAVYFGLWHSTRHLEVIQEALRWESIHLVLQRATPLTAASMLGLLSLVAGMLWLGSIPNLLIVVLLLISGLTLPHALLTHQLLRVERARIQPQPTQTLGVVAPALRMR